MSGRVLESTGEPARGFYFALSHREVGVGGGVYMPAPETLLAIRHHLVEHHREVRKITQARAVRQLFGGMQGEQLTRVPKGFDARHPAADLLRYKQFLLYVELAPELATTPALFPELVKHFRALTPFLDFLNTPLGERKPSAT